MYILVLSYNHNPAAAQQAAAEAITYSETKSSLDEMGQAGRRQRRQISSSSRGALCSEVTTTTSEVATTTAHSR